MNKAYRSNHFKIVSKDYHPWTLKDVVEQYSVIPFDTIVKQYVTPKPNLKIKPIMKKGT